MPHRALALATFLLAVLGSTTPISTIDAVLIAKGSVWKYHDRGTDLGTEWRSSSYADAGWASGPAQLGYGDGDEATFVSYGPESAAKYITTYFRHTFSVADPTLVHSLTLNVLRDDGAVAYLNGIEVFRTNMPTGTIAYGTVARVAIGTIDEPTRYTAAINPALLTAGSNVLAVEIHQANGTSSDLSFDAELIAAANLQITRGPYLQMGTPSSVMVRWRTSGPSDSHVMYGTDQSSLIWAQTDATVTTEHAVRLSGLSPNTKYYYSVGSTTQTLAGGNATHYFVTAPTPGTPVPTRIWILGDSGTADVNARAVRDAYYNFAGTTFANLWLMLGDNAYNSGLDSEFQAAVFDMYPATLRQSVLWPTLGNHDGVAADANTQSGPYFDIFSLPKQGEAGGLPSGTEAYYSFDYGNIHFVSLESSETSRSVSGPMLTWLQNDLASTTQRWVIAFWHHPPYTMGSHNADTEIELIEMRQNAIPILEAAGVDLVLTGHSHAYERSYLIDGHYGPSITFTEAMKKDGGSGREDGTGAYEKPPGSAVPHEGAIYAVLGSSGKISGGWLNHPAMFVSLNLLGSMVLDVNDHRLDARFITDTGAVQDYFTLRKAPAPVGTANLIQLGDVAWTAMTNGWGPAERNRSNGETSATDGRALTLNGRVYQKGLGVHADSNIRYALNSGCSIFQADVGVDDETGANGSIVFQVWADGSKLFDSGLMHGNTPTKSLSVNVQGRSNLTLIVTNGGDGFAYDHGDWADARVTCATAPTSETTTFLSDVAWSAMTNGWGPAERNLSNGELGATDGRILTLNGRPYTKGLGVHASSSVKYALNGTCSTFQADVGVDDETGSNGSVVFQVWADGMKLFDSGVMRGSTLTQPVSVTVSGRTELTLVVTDGGDGVHYDHADWADARVSCTR